MERKILLRELFERRLADIPESKRRKFIKRILEYFLDLLPPGMYIDELTSADLSLYEQKRRADITVQRSTPVKNETIHREMTEISSALNKAPEYFRELENWTCPRIPRPKLTESRRERIISEKEKQLLIDHFARPRQPNESDGHYRDRIRIGHEFEFALLTSSRRKEVVRLKWSDYFPDRDLLKITRWKTVKSKKQSVTQFSPLPNRVREILALRRKLSEGEYIFSKDGTDSAGYLKALKKACKKLEIPYGKFTDGGIIFHDTRHTFVTTMIENNVDIETARELAGLSREMILRYAHSSAEKKRGAVEMLDGEKRLERLRAVYEKIAAGEMTFEEFYSEMTGKIPPAGQKTATAK